MVKNHLNHDDQWSTTVMVTIWSSLVSWNVPDISGPIGNGFYVAHYQRVRAKIDSIKLLLTKDDNHD